MDPASLFFGLSSLLATALQGAKALSDLIGSIRGAPDEVRDVLQDVAALSNLLTILQDFLKHDRIPPSAAASLVETVQNSKIAVEKTQAQLKTYTKVASDGKLTKWRSFTWAFSKGDVKELRDSLLHHKMNLSISVDMINSIQSDTNHEDMSQQINSRTEAKVELASITGRRGSQSGATDVGWTMRKFLEVLPPADHVWSEAGDTFNVNSTNIEDDDDAISTKSLPDFNIIQLPYSFKLSPLHEAVCGGDGDLVLQLLQQGADVNERGFENCTPIHLCADLDNGPIAQLLLSKGALLEVKDKRRRTPLHYAVTAGSKAVALLLLDHGARLDSAWDVILATVEAAADTNSKDMVLALLDHAKTKAIDESRKLNLLHSAVEDGHMAMVELLLEVGFGANDTDDMGFTSLHYAAWSHRIAEAKDLLKAGASVDARTSRDARTDPDAGGLSLTALNIAAGRGDIEMMNLLIANGADVNTKDLSGGTALQALGSWPHSCAQVLLDAGADINNQKHGGETILYWAANCNNVSLINLLVDRGVNMSLETRSGFQALHVAAQLGCLKAAECLVERGAKVNAFNLNGTTPLHEAVRGGFLNIVKVLAQHGAWNLQDHTGETPLMMAERLGKTEISQFLSSAQLPEMIMPR